MFIGSESITIQFHSEWVVVHQSNGYSLFLILAVNGFDQQSVDGIACVPGGMWMGAAVVSLLSNRMGID